MNVNGVITDMANHPVWHPHFMFFNVRTCTGECFSNGLGANRTEQPSLIACFVRNNDVEFA
jgi:hypothetical protein